MSQNLKMLHDPEHISIGVIYHACTSTALY